MRLREEVIRLYDEFGGIEILQKITNIGHNTIKFWHKEYFADREKFFCTKGRKAPKKKRTKCNFVSNILLKDS